MSPEEQARFRPIIEKRIREIDAEIAGMAGDTAAIAPDNAIGRLSRLDAMQMQQMALAGRQRLLDEKSRLIEANTRTNLGSYGRCLRCGRDIATERLEYQPDAVVCVPCANTRK